jgi:hypothetical protein
MSGIEINQSEMNDLVASAEAASAPVAAEFARVVVPEDFTVSSLDAATASGIVEGSLPRIVKHRAAVKAEFGEERAAYIDGLQTLVDETQDAHLDVAIADAGGALGALHAEVLQEHTLLLTDAQALVNRKLLTANQVEPCRPIQGHKATASSTLLLVKLFRENWERIAASTPTKVADLDRAEAKALVMRQRLNEREQGSNKIDVVEHRARLLATLVRQYGEVRRMIGYVRYWNDDADSIAPSLWSGRRGKKRAVGANDGAEDQPTPTPTPTPTPSGPVNGGGPFID